MWFAQSFFIRSLDAYGWLFSLRTRLLTSIHLPSSQAAFLNKHLTAYSKLYRNLASSEKVKALNKLEITNATVSLMWNFVASASEQVAQISGEHAFLSRRVSLLTVPYVQTSPWLCSQRRSLSVRCSSCVPLSRTGARSNAPTSAPTSQEISPSCS